MKEELINNILKQKPFNKKEAILYGTEMSVKYKKNYIIVTDRDILVGSEDARCYHIVGIRHFYYNQKKYNFIYLCLYQKTILKKY